eukprot:7232039-Prymnesium_polylepis.1
MVEGPAPLDEPLGLAHEPAHRSIRGDALASAASPRYSLKCHNFCTEIVRAGMCAGISHTYLAGAEGPRRRGE